MAGERAEEMKSVLEYQCDEIEHSREKLLQQAQFLSQFLDHRNTLVHGSTEHYLRGMHDALIWGKHAVDGITLYDDYDRPYNARYIPDEDVRAKFETIISEAQAGNWENVRANLDAARDIIPEPTEEDN